MNAEALIAGLKALPGLPLARFLNDKGKAIGPWSASPAGPD